MLGVRIVLCCLPNIDGNLIGTLYVQLCLTKMSGNSVNSLDEMEITLSYKLILEYMFNLGLIRRKYVNVMTMIRN